MIHRAIQLSSRRLLSMPSLQVLFLLLVAVVFPLGLRALQLGEFQTPSLNTSLVNALAVILSHLMFLRLTALPGAMGTRYLIPTMLVAHAMTTGLVLVLRVSFDQVLLLVAIMVHATSAFLLQSRTQVHETLQMFLIPTDKDVGAIEGVEFELIAEPDLGPVPPDATIVADFDDLTPSWEQFLARAALRGHLVYDLDNLREGLTGRVRLRRLSQNTFGTLVPGHGWLEVKDKLDRIAALFLLPFLVPVMLGVAIAIKLDDGGPILFKQPRVGRGATTFEVIKFRSMRAQESGCERDDAQTKDDDARITRVGRILRRSRIDELPQIFNVIRGEMSFIGPRPEALVLAQWYEETIAHYNYRHVVKPGITGWAQVNQGHVVSVDDNRVKLQYDFFYIKNFSLWIDLLIATKTIKIILGGSGAR